MGEYISFKIASDVLSLNLNVTKEALTPPHEVQDGESVSRRQRSFQIIPIKLCVDIFL